jgi:prepilin-type N-terminal cleavage/methylation domain-containing protein
MMNFPRRAFTLTELIVVISLIVILLAIAVPSFGSMLRSNERSSAVNAMQIGIQQARDAATRSRGGDSAAVFVFDVANAGRGGPVLTIVTCLQVATIKDLDGRNNQAQAVDRDVFVPVASAQVVQLPRNWNVRAFVPAGAIDTAGNSSLWYNRPASFSALAGFRQYDQNTANWIFPESGMFDPSNLSAGDNGRLRQTFMVRFEAGTGAISRSGEPVTVVFPAIGNAPRNLQADRDPTRATDLRQWVNRVLVEYNAANIVGGSPAPWQPVQQFLGHDSVDTVLARPVDRLSVYNERALAAALGVRPSRATGTIYGDPNDPNVRPTRPTIVDTGRAGDVLNLQRRINRYFNGVLLPDGSAGNPNLEADRERILAPDDILMVARPYSGGMLEVAR